MAWMTFSDALTTSFRAYNINTAVQQFVDVPFFFSPKRKGKPLTMPHPAAPAPLGCPLCCSAIGQQWTRTYQRWPAGAATLCLTLLWPFILLELPLPSAAQQHAEGAPIKGARKGEGVGGRWFGALFGGERHAQDEGKKIKSRA